MPDGQDASSRPLAGLRVIDLATGPLGAIGRMLGELGADVIRVEPRSGAPDRSAAPLIGGIGVDFVAANTGKRSIALDLDDAADRVEFDTLLAGADVLIERCEPGSRAARVLDAAGLHRRHPSLVILSATPFGATGAYCRWQATDPVLHALSGELSRSGIAGRAPLLPPGQLAQDCAIVQAVFVILLALVNRLGHGQGDHLDFSLLDAASQALDPGYGIAGSASAGVPASQLPRGRMEARFQYPIIRCADGYVRICVLSPRQWQGMFTWMGRPAAFADESFNQLGVRFSSPDLVPAIAQLFANRTRAELEEEGQRYGVPTAALLRLDEALATDQIAARHALRTVTVVPGCTVSLPDGVVEIDGQRMGIPGPAPGLGEHCAAMAWPPRPRDAASASGPANGPPLAGLLVLDFGVIVVGAEQGRLLADQGADVIKVETAAYPDGSRQDKRGGVIAPTFAAGHFNKQSLGINLRAPEGRALLLRLVEQSDIVLSNFKPGTLTSLGLDYATLSALNPRLIMVDSSAFGPTGPWSGRLGYGPLVRASTGLTAQWRYPGEPDSFSDALTVYPDHVAARIGAIAALALLIRRASTGRGGTASVAQNEVMLSHMAGQIAAGALTVPQDAPWGVFACAGDDEWCVVTVRHDDDWQRLCAVIGRADLAQDPALATASGRSGSRALVDRALADWMAQHGPIDAMQRLQAAGVPAGAMLRVAELPYFPYYVERGAYRLVKHPHIAQPFHREAAPVRSQLIPPSPDRPSPLLGEHTIAIAAERLGLSDAEIGRLIEAGILEAPPLPAPLQHAV
jgi:crotonobetainyl-CoA:carnitine CoA-transferase CaiB-like acyl-CoA transferase